MTRGRSAAPELAQSVPKVGAPSFWGLGHAGRGQGDRGDRHRRRRRPSAARSSARRASRPRSRASELVGPLRPGRRRHRGLRQRRASTSASAVPATCSTRRPAGRAPQPPDAGATAPTAPRWPRWPPATSPRPAWPPTPGCTRSRCSTPPGSSADFVDILLALDHVADLADARHGHRGRQPLAVQQRHLPVALRRRATTPTPTPSRSGPRSSGSRPAASPPRSPPATTAQTGSIGLPACVSNAIAVGRLRPRRPDRRLRQPRAHGRPRRARRPRGQRLARPHGHPREPGHRVGRAPRSPRRTWPAPSPCCRRSTRRPSVAPAARRTSAPPARPPPIPTPAPPTAASACARPAQAPRRPACCSPPSPAVAGTAAGRVGDFDGDGLGDVLAHAPGTRRGSHLLRRGRAGPRRSARYAVAGSYAPARRQLPRLGRRRHPLVRARARRPTRLWTGGSSRTFASAPRHHQRQLLPAGRRLRRRRLRRHRLVRARRGRATSLWYGGPSGFTSRPMSLNGTYRVAVGDFNGDGRDDLVFHGPGAAADALWRGTATRGTWAQVRRSSIGGTNVLRAGDFDGDARRRPAALPGRAPGPTRSGAAAPAVGGGGPTGGFSPLAIVGQRLATSRRWATSTATGATTSSGTPPGSTADHIWFGRPTRRPPAAALSVSGTYTPLLADLDADAGDDIVWFQSRRVHHPGVVEPHCRVDA